MLKVVPFEPDRALRILAIGAHPDDIELGCGGTLLTLQHTRRASHLTWVVVSGTGPRRDEAHASAAGFLSSATSADVQVHAFRDGFFPYQGAEIKDVFETLKDVRPDVIFTHARHDLHQDHRLVNELTWNTFRDHLVLEYEIPKFDGDLASPNLYVPLEEGVVAQKMRLLQEYFPSQLSKHWFDEELFRGLHRIRAVESGGGARYAEGFTARKVVLGLVGGDL